MSKLLSINSFRVLIFRAFSVAIIARIVQVCMAVILARTLDPVGYGLFTFALGVAVICGTIGGLGWPTTIVRFFPYYYDRHEKLRLKALMLVALGVSLTGPAILSVGLVTATQLIEMPEDIRQGLLIAAIMAVPIGLRQFTRQKLAACGRSPLGLFLDEFLSPAGVVIFGVWLSSASQAAVVYSLFGIAGFAVGELISRRALIDLKDNGGPPVSKNNLKEWLWVSLPLTVGLMSRALMNRVDSVMLAPLSNLEEVGYYAAAFRITYLITFPQVVVSLVLSPKFSKAFSAKLYNDLISTLRFGLIISLLSVSIFCLLILLFGSQIISFVFGEQFSPSYYPLIILTISQSISAVIIPMNAFLTVSGDHNLFGLITLIGIVVTVLLNLWLIPLYGAVGAAISAMIVGVILLFLSVISVRNRMKFCKRNWKSDNVQSK
ncbi:oligosaccharide flippase family protein [Amaricoccus macauensis]|uniref:oligosaccharide flippase family protein n=1 Tax=Amaricoccus macauensis TaxID=57001 RepID=UPI003C7A87AD